MPNVPKKMFRGAASTTTTTLLYTVTAPATSAVLTNVTICNTSGSTQTATIFLEDVEVIAALPLGANSTTSVDMRQVIPVSGTIKGGASATSVDFHISGMEIQ